jgi:hypothetical protein
MEPTALWVNEGPVPGVAEQVRSHYLGSRLATLWRGHARVRNGTSCVSGRWPHQAIDRRNPTIFFDRFGAGQGLDAGGASVIPVWQAKPYFSRAGIKVAVLRDEKSGRFVEDRTFEVLERDPESNTIFFSEGPEGRVYVTSGRSAAVLTRQADGTYTTDRQLFSRFALDRNGAFYPEKDGVLWFGVAGKLARFDTTRFNRTHTAVFHDHPARLAQPDRSPDTHARAAPTLPASSRALRFEFAAPSFLNERATQYQSRLDGLDADWSAWSDESRRDYTNLSFGDYRFHVRAKNELSQVSEEGLYSFVILPPWYRTWWAYGLYLSGSFCSAVGFDRVQRRRVIGKERQRAEFAEARLRADSAEALAQAERERNRNIETLSEMGREITASLDFDTIFGKLYERVNQLADADVFGVGLYHPEHARDRVPARHREGQALRALHARPRDRDQFAVWCIEHAQPVFINDVTRSTASTSRTTTTRRAARRRHDVRQPQSMIYLPLLSKDKVLGIITIQSFKKNAYTEHHLNVMQNLAAYTSIALDNASAYRQLNEQENENRRLFEEAQRRAPPPRRPTRRRARSSRP